MLPNAPEDSDTDEGTTPTVPVESVSVSPMTSSADAGTSGTRQLSVTVTPEDTTDKSVTYILNPAVSGISVSETGLVAWDETVPSGEYTTTITTTDGNKQATHVLTLDEPTV